MTKSTVPPAYISPENLRNFHPTPSHLSEVGIGNSTTSNLTEVGNLRNEAGSQIMYLPSTGIGAAVQMQNNSLTHKSTLKRIPKSIRNPWIKSTRNHQKSGQPPAGDSAAPTRRP
jgi:hypothetical protein